jgi:hypothetical protein
MLLTQMRCSKHVLQKHFLQAQLPPYVLETVVLV